MSKAKMTELEKKLGEKFAVYSVLPKAEQRGFIIGYSIAEERMYSEIDELKAEVERLNGGSLEINAITFREGNEFGGSYINEMSSYVDEYSWLPEQLRAIATDLEKKNTGNNLIINQQNK